MAYRVITVKDGEVTSVEGNTTPRRGKPSTLDVGTFGQSSGGWPMECDATGVNPDQIESAMAADAKKGVSIEYNRETGAAIYADSAQRKNHCESLGIADRNGGYSDPQVGGYKKYER